MALPNFPVDHTAPKPVGGDSVTVKIPKSAIYIVVVILVLTAVYVLGTTFKERVTDPAIDKTVETVDNVAADIAAIPGKASEELAEREERQELERLALLSAAAGLPEMKCSIVSAEQALTLARNHTSPSSAARQLLENNDAENLRAYVFVFSENTSDDRKSVDAYYRDESGLIVLYTE